MGLDAEHRDLVMLEVVRVPVLSDNYAWLVFDTETHECACVDPGEATPLLAEAKARGWHIGQVWLTHWHADHSAGVPEMKAAGATIIGPRSEVARIKGPVDTTVDEDDVIRLSGHTGKVWRVPGHTQGHLAFWFEEDKALFTGDTLFAMGCGRLFEGTPADMFGNMRRYEALPDDTRVYCGHEYTLSNARFAVTAEPDEPAIRERLAEVEAMRARGEATVPTDIARERATNPFLRAETVERFAELRAGKDAFKG